MGVPLLTYAAFSRSRPGKPHCGDSWSAFTNVHDEANTAFLVAAIADGVSTRPADWRASQTACETFIEALSIDGPVSSTEMTAGAERAHEAVRHLKGSHAGGCTTLCGLVVDLRPDLHDARWISIGDSRIYRRRAARLEQLTVDDIAIPPVEALGGGPLRLLARFLGQPMELSVAVEGGPAALDDEFFLATDGAYEQHDFEDVVTTISRFQDVDEGVLSATRHWNNRALHDDTTLVVVRGAPSDVSGSDAGDPLEEDQGLGFDAWHPQRTLRHHLATLQAAIRDRDIHGCREVIERLHDARLVPDRGSLAGVLDEVAVWSPPGGREFMDELLALRR